MNPLYGELRSKLSAVRSRSAAIASRITTADGLLQQELDRAKVCKAADLPKTAVGLNRWLHYADERHPEVRRVQLVLPREADIDAGRVSILSHVGAGLIGLKEGESISWPDPSGETRKLTAVLIEDEDPIEAVAH